MPFEAITYLTGECNYGGRVTDNWDRRLLNTMLADFYNRDVVEKPSFPFSPSGDYVTPPKSSYDDYLRFIKVRHHTVLRVVVSWLARLSKRSNTFAPYQELPVSQHPEIFGMHENVDISKDLQQTKLLFDSLLLTQGRGSKGGGSSGSDNALYDIASDILTKVPWNISFHFPSPRVVIWIE